MNSNDTWLHSLAAQTSCWSGWPRGFDALIDSRPHSWIFTSVPVGSSHHSYLFTAARGRIGVHFAPKYGKKPIRYVTLHFRDRRGTASLRHGNCDVTTVHVCKQKPYAVWFSWRRKSHQWPNLKQILMKNWHLIEQQPLLSEIYKKPPLASYKRGRSLKDILVRAKL